jgi:hypothetical protein
MEIHRHIPNVDRLSIVTATILIAYAATPYIRIPGRVISLQLPGFLFELQLNFNTIVSILVAILAAAGTDWVIQDHPHKEGKTRLPHWLLPALTAWAIGIPLTTLENSPQWWVVFALGGLLFVLVLVAEYIVVDANDLRHAPASVGLTAVAFALYLILAISVRAAGLRLYMLLLVLVPTVFLVSTRALYLRCGGQWHAPWAFGIAIVVGQAATGLHYWALTPLPFGLILVGLALGLTTLAANIEQGRTLRRVWQEPTVMVVLIWGLALLLGS